MMQLARSLPIVVLLLNGLFLTGGCKPRVETPAEVSVVDNVTVADVEPISVAQDDWPWWRGPGFNNEPSTEAGALSQTLFAPEQMLWSVDLPGKGRSTPIILGEVAYLTSGIEAENEAQAVLAYDTDSGAAIWKTVVHTGGFDPKVHAENSQASPTMATDGQRLFCVFMSKGQVHATALDLEGEILWSKAVGAYHSLFGFGPSPLVFGNAVYVPVDHEQGGFLVALRRDTGEVIWLKQRPRITNYTTPVLAQINGRAQILMTGGHKLTSFDALSGQQLWEVEALCQTMVGTPIVLRSEDGNATRFIGSGGYPESQSIAIDLTSTPPRTLWTNKDKIYIPSPAISRDRQTLYAVDDEGIAMAWNVETGQQLWKKRIGGAYSASALLVGDHLLAASEQGKLTLMKVSPQKDDVEILAETELNSEIFASPILVQGKLYLRTGSHSGGNYAEKLTCIDAAIPPP